MDYTLAKQLKEAGFPHPWLLLNGGPDLKDDPQIFPTLEELIEACGWNLWRLEQTELTKQWVARGRSKEPMEGEIEEYFTPTEAVARLWLALNKKI